MRLRGQLAQRGLRVLERLALGAEGRVAQAWTAVLAAIVPVATEAGPPPVVARRRDAAGTRPARRTCRRGRRARLGSSRPAGRRRAWPPPAWARAWAQRRVARLGFLGRPRPPWPRRTRSPAPRAPGSGAGRRRRPPRRPPAPAQRLLPARPSRRIFCASPLAVASSTALRGIEHGAVAAAQRGGRLLALRALAVEGVVDRLAERVPQLLFLLAVQRHGLRLGLPALLQRLDRIDAQHGRVAQHLGLVDHGVAPLDALLLRCLQRCGGAGRSPPSTAAAVPRRPSRSGGRPRASGPRTGAGRG